MEFYLSTTLRIIGVSKPINYKEFKKFMRKLPKKNKYEIMDLKEVEEIKRKQNVGT